MAAASASNPMPPARPGLWRVLGMNFLPGLLAGIQFTGLLFFLNPRLPFSFGPLSRGGALFGGVLGLLSAGILTLLSRHRARPGRLLPWATALVLAGAALLAWLHASYFSFLIPPGINARLIKAAIWLTLGALACFYTALLHSIQQRPYSLRTRLGLSLVALASVVILLERRDAYSPEEEPPAWPTIVQPAARPRLVVVGIEAATLDAILPLARQGTLPFFAQLIERGAYARLASLSPPYESAVWTSLATGKFPYKHGLPHDRVYPADFLHEGSLLRLLPAGFEWPLWRSKALRPLPAGRRARTALAGWEVLTRLGMSAGFVGWPATHEPLAALEFGFSDRFFEDDYGDASARPPELVERGVLFQLGVDELDPDTLAPFGPEVPHALLRSLAEDRWRTSLTTFLLEQKPDLQALFLMLPGLEQVSRDYFGGYSAVQFDGVQDPRYRQASQYVIAYYRFLDAFLEQLWGRTGPATTLAVVSAYGSEPVRGPWKLWSELSRRPYQGRHWPPPDGVLFLMGEAIRPGTFLQGATLVDVMPTLLYALRLPIARDLDGRVLTAAFQSPYLSRNPLTYVPSYEQVVPEESPAP